VFWSLTNLPVASSTVRLFVATALGAATYLLVHSPLISIPVALSCREPYFTVLRQILAFDVGAFPFALLGLGLGWVYLELGAAVVPLLVVPILIARSTFASYLELKAGQEQTIETLILALEAKDPYTAGHAQRVATFSEYVGAELAFGQRRMERLRYAALMHDIGKLVVPNQILNKPGRLTEAEFERVKRHETVSVELLHRIDFLAPVAGDTTTEAATAAVDGTDLIEPAIIHVADAFDAMTSTRSYRRALSQETAFAELRDGAGTQFNAACVDALIHSIERRGEQYGAGHEVDEHEWAVAPPEAGTGSAGLGHLVSEELVPEEQAAGS
jgi:HD superfamily phosphodiesterase